MRYFAMIDGERRGPFELDALADVGVRPDTYVWCKGMADWEKAEDVAEICRWYRQRIFGLMHPPRFPESNVVQTASNADLTAGGTMPADTSAPPPPTLFTAILMTLLCFPITGIVAVYYSYKARASWQESRRSDSPNSRPLYSEAERQQLRRQAHDYSRQAMMWIGITFFLSFILYAFLGHRFL